MANARRHRNIELATAERRRNYLVPEANYHTTKFFIKTLLTIEMRETQILMNKPVHLGISILDLSKNVTCVFLVLLCKTKISRKSKTLLYQCRQLGGSRKNRWYLQRHYRRSDTSNYKLNRPLSKVKNKRFIDVMKNKLNEKFIKQFVGLRVKTYSYLMGVILFNKS